MRLESILFGKKYKLTMESCAKDYPGYKINATKQPKTKISCKKHPFLCISAYKEDSELESFILVYKTDSDLKTSVQVKKYKESEFSLKEYVEYVESQSNA